jgi:hypothetical protein
VVEIRPKSVRKSNLPSLFVPLFSINGGHNFAAGFMLRPLPLVMMQFSLIYCS